MCPQREEFNGELVGTLDCLNLNVYVPNTASAKNRRPVLVWIHGGGFATGAGGRTRFGPKYLVRHDVIVVTLNYRLGAYGFLCLNTPEVPGNQALKDQLAALRWIKNNIEAFGGDKDKITVGGDSAGGVSVDFHMIFTQENLFRSIILESGSALAPFTTVPADQTAPLKLAENLGKSTDDLSEAMEFLRTANTGDIVKATADLGFIFWPCVEKQFENVEALITKRPDQASVPNAKTVSVLTGFNSNEFGYNFDKKDDDDDWNPFVDIGYNFDYEPEKSAEIINITRRFYIGEEDISKDVKDEIANFRSDFIFVYPTYRTIQNYFANGASTIYHYLFSYEGGRNYAKRLNKVSVKGAIHGDELGYLFDAAVLDETPSSEDQLTIDRMTALWTNFVKHSNPTPEVTDILPVQLPTVEKEVMHCLKIDSDLTLQKQPFHERMAFWDLFFKLDKEISRAN